MLGSDGRDYVYLLKGREDLHLDERLMQFLRVANGLLQSSTATRSAGLRARWYSVTPLAGRVGLIQWVSDTVSLYGLFRAWQQRQQGRHQVMVDAIKQGEAVNPLDFDLESRSIMGCTPCSVSEPTTSCQYVFGEIMV